MADGVPSHEPFIHSWQIDLDDSAVLRATWPGLHGLCHLVGRPRSVRREHVMETPPIVSPQEWEAAREKLLVNEKEITRARDALAAERRRMPWMAVEKDYRFEGHN